MPSKQDLKDLTLLLIQLQSWDENQDRKLGPDPVPRSWIGYDHGILDELSKEGFIKAKRGRKSCFVTREGTARARELERRFLGSSEMQNPS